MLNSRIPLGRGTRLSGGWTLQVLFVTEVRGVLLLGLLGAIRFCVCASLVAEHDRERCEFGLVRRQHLDGAAEEELHLRDLEGHLDTVLGVGGGDLAGIHLCDGEAHTGDQHGSGLVGHPSPRPVAVLVLDERDDGGLRAGTTDSGDGQNSAHDNLQVKSTKGTAGLPSPVFPREGNRESLPCFSHKEKGYNTPVFLCKKTLESPSITNLWQPRLQI